MWYTYFDCIGHTSYIYSSNVSKQLPSYNYSNKITTRQLQTYNYNPTITAYNYNPTISPTIAALPLQPITAL